MLTIYTSFTCIKVDLPPGKHEFVKQATECWKPGDSLCHVISNGLTADYNYTCYIDGHLRQSLAATLQNLVIFISPRI